MGTRRTQRLASLILAELAQVMRESLRDPRLKGVTLTGVDVSPDVRTAKVFYSVLNQATQPAAQAGLDKAAGFMRRELAQRLDLKVVPQLTAVYDPSLADGAHMDQLIGQALAQDKLLNQDDEE